MATKRQTFRLYPNKEQENKLFEARRNHAYLYNACVAHRRYEWKANKQTVTYFEQQNCLPAFKKEWVEFAYLHSQAMQATVKRVDLAYGAFFQGLRGVPKFKSIRNYSGWTYPAKSGWKVNSNGKHGTVTLNDLGITLKMRGQAKQWGIPTTLTIVYKPSKNQWYASMTVDVPPVERQFLQAGEPLRVRQSAQRGALGSPRSGDGGRPPEVCYWGKPPSRNFSPHAAALTVQRTASNKFGSESTLEYESIVAFDLGTETALTLYNGEEFTELENPRFTQKAEQKIKQKSKALRRKRAPNRKKKIKGSRRWKKARKQISKLQRKVSTQRKDWQHKVTSDIASRYDIGVTEQLNTKGMTRKAKKGSKREARRTESSVRQTSHKKQKAGLNKSILSVGFGTLNKMIAYKIEQKGGLMLTLPTKQIKPSQRCPKCGEVHKHWAELSNRYHICNACGFEVLRDRGSVMVMYNVATNQQPGLGTNLVDCGCPSSTNLTSSRKHTGSMRQLGQMKRQKSNLKSDGELETPSSYEAG